MSDNESIILNFGTKPHDIDSRTLVTAFGSIESALRQIAHAGHPSTEISIRVKAFKAGSFEVPIEVKQCIAAGALAMHSVDWSSARDSIKILIELIKLAVSLKGAKPKSVAKADKEVRIEQNKNSVIYVDQRTYNIHVKDAAVGEALAKGFGALDLDRGIKSFDVLDKKRQKLLHVPRKSFKHIAKSSKTETPKEKTDTERVTLRVFKVVLEKGYKWEFYYQGFKISATIDDQEFQDRITKGERFGRGDSLDVELAIQKKFDEGAQSYANRSYSIKRVHRIVARSIQADLELK